MELTYEKNGGLSDTKPDTGQRAGGTADQVRSDAQEIPDGTTEGIYSGC